MQLVIQCSGIRAAHHLANQFEHDNAATLFLVYFHVTLPFRLHHYTENGTASI
jgi:hypothetical protein